MYHHFVSLGGTVELVCTVKNGNEYPILWMKLEDERKNNPVPISTGNKLFFKNSRYSLEFDPNAGSYKLIINDEEQKICYRKNLLWLYICLIYKYCSNRYKIARPSKVDTLFHSEKLISSYDFWEPIISNTDCGFCVFLAAVFGFWRRFGLRLCRNSFIFSWKTKCGFWF